MTLPKEISSVQADKFKDDIEDLVADTMATGLHPAAILAGTMRVTAAVGLICDASDETMCRLLRKARDIMLEEIQVERAEHVAQEGKAAKA